MLATNRLSGFTPIGLPQNADNLFSTMRFAFHQGPPCGLTKTHATTGSTIGGHAKLARLLAAVAVAYIAGHTVVDTWGN